MAVEDRIRPSVDAAVDDLTSRVSADVRALAARLLAAAREEHDEALNAALERETALTAARDAAVAAATAETGRRVEEAEARGRVLGREAEMAAYTRLLDSIRMLDSAATLTDVLDALASGAAREASRTALLVVRHDRLLGWKTTGLGASDAQPRTIDVSLLESSVAGLAVRLGRSVTTREVGAQGMAFAPLIEERLGLAVPVMVGGRAVAVVYADSSEDAGGDVEIRDSWPEVLEVLARHAARCLEALTVQKTATAAAPRFWMQAGGRPGASA